MLDTNIVLAMVLPSDRSFEDANKYFKTEFLRYISENVCDEAETKISNIQIISLDISEFIKDYSLKNQINYLKMDKEKTKIKNNFINQFKNTIPINMPQDRFDDLVRSNNEITKVLIDKSNKNLNTLIKKAFSKNTSDLNKFVNKFYCISFISSGSKIRDFEKIDAHKKDAIL